MLRKVCNILSSFSPRISLDRKTELFCSLIAKSGEEEQTREYVRSGVEQELSRHGALIKVEFALFVAWGEKR